MRLPILNFLCKYYLVSLKIYPFYGLLDKFLSWITVRYMLYMLLQIKILQNGTKLSFSLHYLDMYLKLQWLLLLHCQAHECR